MLSSPHEIPAMNQFYSPRYILLCHKTQAVLRLPPFSFVTDSKLWFLTGHYMETKRQGQWLSVGRSLQEKGTYDANTYKLGLIIGKKRSRSNSHKLIPTNRIRTEVLKVYPLKNIPKIRLDTRHKRISYEKFQERKFDVFPMWIELRLMPYEPKSILPRLWRRRGKSGLFHSKMQFTARKYGILFSVWKLSLR